jgi:uncharacterized phiE125 gp8 family phage protein
MTLETLVPPAAEPVTLAEAQAFARVGSDGDDRVIASLIVAAREAFEARTGRALVARRVRQRFAGPRAAGTLRLWAKPVAALVEACVVDATGAETVAPPGLVRLQGDSLVVTRDVPGLLVTYDAGYGAPSAVPQAFKVSILEAVADALQRREAEGGDGSSPWVRAFDGVRL